MEDFGSRFSDTNYFTKDEVKKALNISSIESIWDKVLEYRSHYTKRYGLKNIERKDFLVVLTPSWMSKIVENEKRLSRLLVSYTKMGLKASSKVEFERQVYHDILRIIADTNRVEISDESIYSLIDESVSTIPPEFLAMFYYYKTLKHYQTHFHGPVDVHLLVQMYLKLSGKEIDSNVPLSTYFRTKELNNQIDHVFIGNHYEGAPLDRIEESLTALSEFINTSNAFPLVKAIVSYFMIQYLKPFEYFNEEISILLFKYVLGHFDNEDLAAFICFEEVLLDQYQENLKAIMLESELKQDLTYIIVELLKFVEEGLERLSTQLVKIDVQMVKQEYYNRDEEEEEVTLDRTPVTRTVPIYLQEPSYELKSSEGINFERKVSLPTLPVGLDQKDAELIRQHLLEIYPSLKENQADFYSRHCTIGKYYSISQYKKEQEVAYETARTSMDNLALLGFYKKEKIKNKFVYTPVIRN